MAMTESGLICPFGYYDDLRAFEKKVNGRDFPESTCRSFTGTKAELLVHLADHHQGSILPVLLMQLVDCRPQERRK